MTGILARDSYDPRPVEYRRIAVGVLGLLVMAAVWHGTRDRLLYHAACSSVGCPGREDLIAAALRQADPQFREQPDRWYYSLAHPGWIAWSSVREVRLLADGSQFSKWQVTVADNRLAVRGVVDGGWLSAPPMDPDGDGSCEVMMEFYPPQDDPQQDLCWRAVVRLGEEYNEIVWLGLFDESVWHSRRMRLKPIWRDEDSDGKDELVFITVEIARLPKGGIIFKPPQTVAVFEWTAPGGILRTRLLPDDCGVVPWSPPEGVPLRVGQTTDLDALVPELLRAAESEGSNTAGVPARPRH